MFFRIARWLLAACVLIQLIPFGRRHTNPPAVLEPPWDSPQTRALAKRACFNCHSNETVWPWYASVAPVSWLTQRDVDEGRAHLSFSQWNQPQRHAGHAVEEIKSGDMPPWFYLPMHPEAKLSAAEQSALMAGFQKMPGFEDTDEEMHGH